MRVRVAACLLVTDSCAALGYRHRRPDGTDALIVASARLRPGLVVAGRVESPQAVAACARPLLAARPQLRLDRMVIGPAELRVDAIAAGVDAMAQAARATADWAHARLRGAVVPAAGGLGPRLVSALDWSIQRAVEVACYLDSPQTRVDPLPLLWDLHGLTEPCEVVDGDLRWIVQPNGTIRASVGRAGPPASGRAAPHWGSTCVVDVVAGSPPARPHLAALVEATVRRQSSHAPPDLGRAALLSEPRMPTRSEPGRGRGWAIGTLPPASVGPNQSRLWNTAS